MSVRLSERDLRVICKCAVAKWLTTSQLQRLYFPGVTPDAARKSLRRLVEAGYLISFRENLMAEAMLALGPKGKALLDARGFQAELARTPPRQVEHLVGVNDIRVAVELAPQRVAYFFASWELPRLGWEHPVVPDAVCALKWPERRVVVSFEYDRATETLDTVMRKLRSYQEGLAETALDGVALVTDSALRLQALSRQLRGMVLPTRPVGALLGDIQASGLYANVFRALCDPQRQLQSLAEAIHGEGLAKDGRGPE